MEKLTMIRGISGTGRVALIIADLGRVWWHGITAGAVVALAQDGNLVSILGARVQACAIGLVAVGGVAL